MLGHVARLISVNVGRPRQVSVRRGRPLMSAIGKAPVEGRIHVAGVNVEGDEQADLRVHGGPDKAVYAYSLEETRAWEQELGREIGPGGFGENLTLEGVDVSGARVGERWRIGTVLLETTEPRDPCFKLNLRMGDNRFGKRFLAAARPGAYLRILEEGELGAGDAVEVVRRPEHDVTMRLMMLAARVDRTRLPELLAAPDLTDEWREYILAHSG
jgi:MOSC domain-containing protein YiiM